MKDNHLLINGKEKAYDIYMSVSAKPSFEIIKLLGILTFLLVGVCLIPASKAENMNRAANVIDVYRSLSAISILGVHCASAFITDARIQNMWSAASGIGIAMFAAVSGYLVWQSYDRYDSVKKYIFHRVGSIYPTYIAMIGTMWLYYTLNRISLPEDSSHLYWLRYIFCLNTIVPTTENIWVNLCATWMIPAFFVFYFIVPLLKKYVQSFKTALIFFGISWGFRQIFTAVGTEILKGSEIDQGIVASNPLNLLYLFIYGIVVHFAQKEDKGKELMLFCAIIGVMSIIFGAIPFEGVVVLLLLYLSDRLTGLKSKVFQDFNRISFAIYMFHSFLLVAFSEAMNSLPSGACRFIFIFVYAIYFAYVVQQIITALHAGLFFKKQRLTSN